VNTKQGTISDFACRWQALVTPAHDALKFTGSVLPLKITLGAVCPPLRNSIGDRLGQAHQSCHDRARKCYRPRGPVHMR
jgi:hypothetical protein